MHPRVPTCERSSFMSTQESEHIDDQVADATCSSVTTLQTITADNIYWPGQCFPRPRWAD